MFDCFWARVAPIRHVWHVLLDTVETGETISAGVGMTNDNLNIEAGRAQ